MSRAPAPGPDPLSLNISSADAQRSRLPGSSEERPGKPDFAQLTQRFRSRAQHLAPELSADLALDIVLNEIVEQACLATGASGAAIALRRDGELVCRASSGSNAPGLGVRLETEQGLSAEAMRTRLMQITHDAATDPRVDAIAAQQLGVRSVIVLPLVRGHELIGLLEAFSAHAGAFGERDLRVLETLARRAIENVELASNWVQTEKEDSRAPQRVHRDTDWKASEANEKFAVNPRLRSLAEAARLAEAEPVATEETVVETGLEPYTESSAVPPIFLSRTVRALTWILGTVVATSAIVLTVLAWRRVEGRRPEARASGAPMSSSRAASGSTPPNSANASTVVSPQPGSASVNGSTAAPPVGSLQVFQDGKEVFRMTPSSQLAGKSARATATAKTDDVARAPDSIVELPSGEAEQNLIRRIEPEYPPEARQQGIQGEVVLEVRIHADGSVQDALPVSGQPLLASAAITAVRQWRFRPHTINGHAVEMQTRVTLDFRLPN